MGACILGIDPNDPHWVGPQGPNLTSLQMWPGKARNRLVAGLAEGVFDPVMELRGVGRYVAPEHRNTSETRDVRVIRCRRGMPQLRWAEVVRRA
jgi:hypothetical protein